MTAAKTFEALGELDATERYVIERGVPLPPRPRNGLLRVGITSYLRKLDVGDVLRVPGLTEGRRAGIHKLAHHIGIKVATRKLPEGGYGIWRLA